MVQKQSECAECRKYSLCVIERGMEGKIEPTDSA